MPDYKYLIFDVDDTLLDFYKAFSAAQVRTAEKLGIEPTKEFFETDEKCGRKAWKESGLERTEDKEVQKNYHVYYFDYITKHFEYLLDAYGAVCDIHELVDLYLQTVSSSSISMEAETLSVYAALSERYKLALATNGIEAMQKERLSGFLPYTCRLYVSEKIGFIKPSEHFFSYILNDLRCRPEDCLMVGDSVTNDVIGAKSAGMDVCWYNPKIKRPPENAAIDYEIYSINELIKLLL